MDIELLELMKEFPLLTNCEDGQYWSGFISYSGILIRLILRVPNYPNLADISLEGDEDTWTFFKNDKSTISKLIEDSEEWTLIEFLRKFQRIIEGILSKRAEKTLEIHNPTFYTNLVFELEQIGLKNISSISKDYYQINIKQNDPSNRTHTMLCQLSNRYPHLGLKISADIPFLKNEKFSWPSKMIEANEVFFNFLAKFNNFWDEMEDFDANTNVIDPSSPNRSHTHRRISLKDKITLLVKFDPERPRELPEIKFTGPEKRVEELENLIQKNIMRWNKSRSVLENIEEILEMKLPEKELGGGGGAEEELSCTICYTYNFEDEIPDKTCDCGSLFHNRCLYELLTTEFSKNIGPGRSVQCPVCSEEIKVDLKN